MARIALTEDQIIAFHPAFEAAGLTDTGAFRDINNQWCALPEESPMVATEETLADWIAARGEPTKRVGDVAVFDETKRVPSSKGDRHVRLGRTVYVLPTAFGTVAIVETI